MKAFATPPCLSLQASVDCQAFVTSIVNNSECVPRASLVNLRTLNNLFLNIHEKLEDRGLHLESFSSAQAYDSDLMEVDDNLLLQPEELVEFEERARAAEQMEKPTLCCMHQDESSACGIVAEKKRVRVPLLLDARRGNDSCETPGYYLD